MMPQSLYWPGLCDPQTILKHCGYHGMSNRGFVLQWRLILHMAYMGCSLSLTESDSNPEDEINAYPDSRWKMERCSRCRAYHLRTNTTNFTLGLFSASSCALGFIWHSLGYAYTDFQMQIEIRARISIGVTECHMCNDNRCECHTLYISIFCTHKSSFPKTE